jgi:septum formation protein
VNDLLPSTTGTPARATAAATAASASVPTTTAMEASTYGEHSVHSASGGQTDADAAVAAAVARAGVPVVLGSKSFTRKAILGEMGLPYRVVVADIDERAIRMDTPEALVSALANAKADAIVARIRDGTVSVSVDGGGDVFDPRGDRDGSSNDSLSACLLITCDQVVVYDGAVREKPRDACEARRFITSYGEKPVSTVGAVAVTDLVTGERFGPLVDRATVRFDPIPTHVVDFLIDEGTCLHCAGGLMVEHPKMVALAAETEGSADALMGLSKATVGALLLEALEKRSL